MDVGGLTRFVLQSILFCSQIFLVSTKISRLGRFNNQMSFYFADFREHELMAVAAVMAALSVLGFRKH
jgi:hypothetical protein